MAVSILHRVTGDGMAIVGGIGFIWWLTAAAMGPTAYEIFLTVATSWIGYVVAIGLTWSFCQHLLSGLRHFVLDTGAGYELKSNKTYSMLILVGGLLLTALIWVPILVRH